MAPPVDLDSIGIHCELDDFTDPWSSPQTVLIQHGFGRSSRFWRHWAWALSREFRVLRPDLRGHGRSAAHPAGSSWSVRGLLDDILALLDALDIAKIHYIGEAVGGLLGLRFATEHADRLASLTLVASPLALPGGTNKGETQVDDPTSFFNRTDVRSWAEAFLEARILTVTGEAHRAWVLDQWAANSKPALLGFSELTAELASCDLTKIAVPTLLLSPTESPITSVPDQTLMQSLIEGAQLKLIPGLGHEIYVDRPDECIQAFREFVSGLAGRI
jgi:pimeloyl-ACP methyl ester carboxylesterase